MNPFPSSFPKIRIWGDNNYGSGANNALRGLLQALRHLGLGPEQVQVVPVSNGVGIYQEMGEHDWFHPYVYRPVIDDQINMAVLHPSHIAGKHTSLNSRVNIAYCPWETDKLPEQFVNELNKYDQVWTPCTLVKDTFKKSGVVAPLFVVPHALQEELVEADYEKELWNDNPTVGYYFIGSFNPRKNVEGLIRAWCKTLDMGWSLSVPVRLTLHLVPSARDESMVQGHSWMAQEMVKQFVESLGARKSNIPQFGVLTAPRPYRNILEMHARNHVFVTPSRGEGFCLPAAEAAAFGNLVVGTREAVPFATDLPGKWFKPLESAVVPLTPMPEVSGYELDQNWWEPQKLAEAIVAAKSAYLEHFARAADRAMEVRAKLAPKVVAETIRPLLEEAAEIVARSGW